MYNKTIVLELKNNYAIVIDEGGDVHRIKRKPDMKVGEQIFYTEEDFYEGSTDKIRKFPFMKFAAAAAIFLLLFTGVFTSLMQNRTYAAMSIGTAAHPLTIEFRKDGKIKSIQDPYGQISSDLFEGKTLEESIDLLVEQMNATGIRDIVLSSTFPAEDFEKLRPLLARLQQGTKKAGILFMNASAEDYKVSKAKGEALNSYLIKDRQIPLWSDEDADALTPARKQEIVGERAVYYQTDDDVQRREEIRIREEQERLRKEEEERKAAEEKAAQEKALQEQQEQQQQAPPQVAPRPRPQAQPRVQPRQQRPVRRAPVYNYDDDDDDWDDDDDDDDDD